MAHWPSDHPPGILTKRNHPIGTVPRGNGRNHPAHV